MKRPPQAPIPISHLGEREKTLGRIPCEPAATDGSSERTVARREVVGLPWREAKGLLGGRKSRRS